MGVQGHVRPDNNGNDAGNNHVDVKLPIDFAITILIFDTCIYVPNNQS